ELSTHDRRRLLLGRDLLAEDVDRRSLPLRVEPADGLSRILQLRTGDVARRELLHDRPRHGREQADDRAVEDRQGPRFYGRATSSCAPSCLRTSTSRKP